MSYSGRGWRGDISAKIAQREKTARVFLHRRFVARKTLCLLPCALFFTTYQAFFLQHFYSFFALSILNHVTRNARNVYTNLEYGTTERIVTNI
jgi:hypothetical protein